MALKSLAITKAKNITSEIADQYQRAFDSLNKFKADTEAQILNLEAIRLWHVDNPGFIDTDVVTEARDLFTHLNLVKTSLASIPPVPNM